MRLQYLGTAAAEGWPSPYCRCDACRLARLRGGRDIRTRSQALVDDCILIDLPADTTGHINQHHIDAASIDHLLITHSHLDHFYPFDVQMRAKPYAHGCNPLHVYGNETVRSVYLDSIPDYMPHMKEHVQFHVVHAFEPFSILDYTITPLRADHKPDEEALFYAVSHGGQSLLYAHDTAFFGESTWESLRGKVFDIVSLDCTYCLMSAPRHHMGLPENIKVRERMLKEGMADANTEFVLNHFTHNCAQGNGYDEIALEAKKHGFLTAYDGMKISTEKHK